MGSDFHATKFKPAVCLLLSIQTKYRTFFIFVHERPVPYSLQNSTPPCPTSGTSAGHLGLMADTSSAAAAVALPCTAYVAMLPYVYTTNDVAKLFEPFGKLARVLVLRDKQTRRSRGVAFVQFARAADCAKAVAQMDGMPLEGMTLDVSVCRDNGRSCEFATKRKYTTSSRCFECGAVGHVSYKCPRNVLGMRERPVTTGGKRSRKKLKKKKKKIDLHERAHYFNDQEVVNILAPPTDSDDKDLSISLLAYPSAASLSSSALPSTTLSPSSAAVSARRRPHRKTDSYFSDEDASDDE